MAHAVGISLLSQGSRVKLDEIHAQLATVVYLAAEHCRIAIKVIDGRRSIERQRELVRTGASRTLNSRHLTGHAVDLAPVVDGVPRWDWPLFFPIAAAMREASMKLNVPLVWGGVFDLRVADLPATELAIEQEQAHYVERCRNRGARPFLDGPHFEIPANAAGYE